MKWAKLVSCYLLAGILSATAILKFVEAPDDSLLGPVSARVLAVLELGLAWGLLRRQDFLWPAIGVIALAVGGGLLASFTTTPCGCSGAIVMSRGSRFYLCMTMGFLACIVLSRKGR
jgi:hypothetical protein